MKNTSSDINLKFVCPLRSAAFEQLDDGSEYCKRCDMCIVDCTDKSAEEIRRLKAETPGRLCISVHEDQLADSYVKLQWRRMVGMVIMLFGLTPAWSQQVTDPGKTLPNGKQGCEVKVPESTVQEKQPKQEVVEPNRFKRKRFRRRKVKYYGAW